MSLAVGVMFCVPLHGATLRQPGANELGTELRKQQAAGGPLTPRVKRTEHVDS
jgi:hypothetical protein